MFVHTGFIPILNPQFYILHYLHTRQYCLHMVSYLMIRLVQTGLDFLLMTVGIQILWSQSSAAHQGRRLQLHDSIEMKIYFRVIGRYYPTKQCNLPPSRWLYSFSYHTHSLLSPELQPKSCKSPPSIMQSSLAPSLQLLLLKYPITAWGIADLTPCSVVTQCSESRNCVSESMTLCFNSTPTHIK